MDSSVAPPCYHGEHPLRERERERERTERTKKNVPIHIPYFIYYMIASYNLLSHTAEDRPMFGLAICFQRNDLSFCHCLRLYLQQQALDFHYSAGLIEKYCQINPNQPCTLYLSTSIPSVQMEVNIKIYHTQTYADRIERNDGY